MNDRHSECDAIGSEAVPERGPVHFVCLSEDLGDRQSGFRRWSPENSVGAAWKVCPGLFAEHQNAIGLQAVEH